MIALIEVIVDTCYWSSGLSFSALAAHVGVVIEISGHCIIPRFNNINNNNNYDYICRYLTALGLRLAAM